MKVDVTQRKMPSFWMQEGSECHPGRTGLVNVETSVFGLSGRALPNARSGKRRDVRSILAIEQALVDSIGHGYDGSLVNLYVDQNLATLRGIRRVNQERK